jgi:nucleoid-associated protein YgaU
MSAKGNEKRDFPKNIRQVGEAVKDQRIYLEDYAIAYLRQVKGAVLLGETVRIRGTRCYFISGAIEVPDGNFEEENWNYVLEEAKKAFEGLEVIGWFLKAEEIPEELNEEDMQVYREHFPGQEAILVVYNELEKEEGVYLTLDGFLRRQAGYYIYYEKNPYMQDYLVGKNEGRKVEQEAVVSDQAIQSFRRIIENKQQKKKTALKEIPKNREESKAQESGQENDQEEILAAPKRMDLRERRQKEQEGVKKSRTIQFLYTASTFLVLTILVIGITMINNYDKMKEMEQTIAYMTENLPVSAGAGTEQTEGLRENQRQVVIDARTGETELLEGILSESELPEEQDSKEQLSGEENPAEKEAASVEEAAVGNQDGLTASASSGETTGESEGETENSAEGLQTAGSNGEAVQTAEPASGEIQASAPPVHASQATYTVKFGDTLANICNRYYGTTERLQELCDLNHITDPNAIMPGEKLVLP